MVASWLLVTMSLKSMNTPSRACCWTASQSGRSDWDTWKIDMFTKCVAVAGISKAVDGASSFVSCRHSGGSCTCIS